MFVLTNTWIKTNVLMCKQGFVLAEISNYKTLL